MAIELQLGRTVSFVVDGGWRVGRVVKGLTQTHPTPRDGQNIVWISEVVLCGKTNQLFQVAASDLKPYPSEPIPEP